MQFSKLQAMIKDNKKFDKRFIEKVRSKVGLAINKYNLIEEGDKIMVGISGGKDSLVLLETLAERRQYSPVKYTVIAVHIHIKDGPYKTDNQFIIDFCKQLNIELIQKEIDIDFSLFPKKTPCFICSWGRRQTLFELTKELECNKLALGHHIDDAIETLMMNMMYHGSISSMPPALEMFKGRIQLIRPLMQLFDKDLRKYAEIKKYPKQVKECIHGTNTKREEIRKLLNEIEAKNPVAKMNIFKSMGNIHHEYIPKS